MSEQQAATYSVNLWGSKPGTNDDCWTGIDFGSKHDAELAFKNPQDFFTAKQLFGSFWIEIDGPSSTGCYRLPRELSGEPEPEGGDGDWYKEQRTQAGMAFGVRGLNDFGATA